jgi:hypothetical protein
MKSSTRKNAIEQTAAVETDAMTVWFDHYEGSETDKSVEARTYGKTLIVSRAQEHKNGTDLGTELEPLQGKNKTKQKT